MQLDKKNRISVRRRGEFPDLRVLEKRRKWWDQASEKPTRIRKKEIKDNAHKRNQGHMWV